MIDWLVSDHHWLKGIGIVLLILLFLEIIDERGLP